ncbi:MAG: hypothetical protein K6U74_05980, partial [Firmicutes bacterium]|nr:hypothetical protein [Bacillota bacterium]
FPSQQFLGNLLSDYCNYQAAARYIFGDNIEDTAGFGKKTSKTCGGGNPSRYAAGSIDNVCNSYFFLSQVPQAFSGMFSDDYPHNQLPI